MEQHIVELLGRQAGIKKELVDPGARKTYLQQLCVSHEKQLQILSSDVAKFTENRKLEEDLAEAKEVADGGLRDQSSLTIDSAALLARKKDVVEEMKAIQVSDKAKPAAQSPVKLPVKGAAELAAAEDEELEAKKALSADRLETLTRESSDIDSRMQELEATKAELSKQVKLTSVAQSKINPLTAQLVKTSAAMDVVVKKWQALSREDEMSEINLFRCGSQVGYKLRPKDVEIILESAAQKGGRDIHFSHHAKLAELKLWLQANIAKLSHEPILGIHCLEGDVFVTYRIDRSDKDYATVTTYAGGQGGDLPQILKSALPKLDIQTNKDGKAVGNGNSALYALEDSLNGMPGTSILMERPMNGEDRNKTYALAQDYFKYMFWKSYSMYQALIVEEVHQPEAVVLQESISGVKGVKIDILAQENGNYQFVVSCAKTIVAKLADMLGNFRHHETFELGNQAYFVLDSAFNGEGLAEQLSDLQGEANGQYRQILEGDDFKQSVLSHLMSDLHCSADELARGLSSLD